MVHFSPECSPVEFYKVCQSVCLTDIKILQSDSKPFAVFQNGGWVPHSNVGKLNKLLVCDSQAEFSKEWDKAFVSFLKTHTWYRCISSK